MKYKVGDWFKWTDDYDCGDIAEITNIIEREYIYTIYRYDGTENKHPGCAFEVVEEVTRKLTKLDKALS